MRDLKLATASDSPPAPWCYWVVPDRLLAGCFPGARDAIERAEKLAALEAAGIEAFFNLMEADERDRSGRPFVPYLSAPGTAHAPKMVRHPIRDRDVPSVSGMRETLDALDEALQAGTAVYVHCWGGIGRTGTVIGCLLLRHQLATPETVFDTLTALRTADLHRGARRSPETEAQREFVRAWHG